METINNKLNELVLNIQYNQTDFIYLAILTIIWMTMVILVNPLGNFPLNDDWAYGKAVQSVIEKGDFQLSGWTATNLFSQVWWGALFCLPFGFSFTALRFSTLTLGLIGVLTTYGLLKEVCSSKTIAFCGALIVAANPIYFALSNTFMSDVPFFAFANLALFLLVRGLRCNSRTEIFIGLIISYIALLVRQLGMAILLAFGFAYIFKKGINIKTILQAFLPTLLGIFVQIIYKKWLENTGRLPFYFGVSVDRIAKIMEKGDLSIIIRNLTDKISISLIYLGLFIFPFIILLLALKLKRFSVRKNKLSLFVGSAIFMTLAGKLIIEHKRMPLSGNILSTLGIGPLTLRDTFFRLSNFTTPMIVRIVWLVLTLIGVFSAVVLIMYFIVTIWQSFLDYKDSRLDKFWLKIFVISAMSIYFLPLGIGKDFFDRYLIWLIPLSMMFLLLSTQTSTKDLSNKKIPSAIISVALTMILFSGIFTIAATHDYLSWNRVRWQALNNLMQEYKVPPNHIDGGFEFNGWYLHDSNYETSDQKSWWWVDRDDYIISFGLLNGYKEIKQYSFHKWLPFGKNNILVLRKNN